MGRLVRINPATEEKNSQAAVVATGAHGRLVRTGDVQRTSPAANTAKTPTAQSVYQKALDEAMMKRAAADQKNKERGRKSYNRTHAQEVREITGDKTKKSITPIIKSAAAGYAADMVGAADTLLRAPSGLNYAASQERGEIEASKKNIAAYTEKLKAAKTEEERQQWQTLIDRNKHLIEINSKAAGERAKNYQDATKGAQETLQDTYQKLRKIASDNMEKANEGLTPVGKYLNNVGVAGAQMAADAALGGGSALGPMFLRVFGGNSQEAAEAADKPGMSAAEQLDAQNRALLYGTASGAVSIATEKISNVAAPFKKAFGGGFLDKAIDGAIAKMNGNAAGRLALSFLSEGGEEVIEDIVQPALQTIYNGKSAGQNYSELDAAEILNDFLVGGALGLIGSGVEGIHNADARLAAERAAGEAAAPTAEQQNTMTAQPAAAQEGAQGVGEGNLTPMPQNAAQGAAAAQNTMPAQPAAAQEGAQGVGKGNLTPVPQNAAQGAQEASTSVDTNPKNHTPEEQKRVEDYRAATDSGIVAFVQKVRTLKNPRYRNSVRYPVSDVSAREASAVLDATGVNTSGFTNNLTGGAVDHIEKRHGASGKADKSMQDLNDLGRVGYILENFDGAELLLNEDGTPSVSDVWKNSDGTPAARMLFTKKVDGVYYTAVATPDSNAGVIAIESAFMSKEKGSTGTVLNMENISPQVTPEAPQRANASFDNTVPQESGGVKAQEGTESAQTAQADNTMTAGGMNHGGQEVQNYAGGAEFADTAKRGTPEAADAASALPDGAAERGERERGGRESGRIPREVRNVGGEDGNALTVQKRLEASGISQFISPREANVPNGASGSNTVTIFEETDWDPELINAANWAKSKGVKKVTALLGVINIEKNGRTGKAFGAFNADTGEIFVNAGSMQRSVSETIEHETAHYLAEVARRENVRTFMRDVQSRYSSEEWGKVYDAYFDRYAALTGDYAGMSESDIELYVWEEVMGDAYAEIDQYDEKASRFNREAENALSQSGQESKNALQAEGTQGAAEQGRENAAATERRTGPPERFSYAGRDARNADLDALHEAERYEMQGVDAETIRQKTGWFRGADGKWRWEIDDSGAETDTKWNFLRNPDAKRYNELFEKAYLYDTATAEDLNELQILDKNLKGVRKSPLYLDEIVKHDKLFEAYPALRDVKVRFEANTGNVEGAYHDGSNEIVLRAGLKLKPEKLKDTLIHEIQHAIQSTEGFSGGSSPEYWARRDYESGDMIETRLQKEKNSILRALGKDEVNKYTRYTELERELWKRFLADENSEDGERYNKLEAEQDAIYEELYPNKWFKSLLDIDRKMENPSEVYTDLYRNTAGEIEARDAAARRGLTVEERRNRKPDTGDENTVFADGGESYSINNTRGLTVREQMKKYRAGEMTSHDEFYYGESPSSLDTAGFNGRPLVMSQKDFRKSRSEKHNVPPRAMTRLTEALSDPVLSFEAGDKIGVLTKDIDGDGKPLLVGVLKNTELDGEIVNRIKSAYGLDDPQAWIKNQIAEGKTLRIYDNEKADSFLGEFGYKAEHPKDYRSGDTIPNVHENVKYSAFNEEVARQLAGEDPGKAKFSAEDEGGEYVFYDVVDMEPTSFAKKEETPTTALSNKALGDIHGASLDDSISKSGENVKYSAESDEFYERLDEELADEKEIDRQERAYEKAERDGMRTDFPSISAEWKTKLERARAAATNNIKPSGFDSYDAYLDALDKQHAADRAERLRVKSRDEFKGTKALDELGVKIANSAGIYHNAEQLLANDKAAKSIQKATKRAEQRLGATRQEKRIARDIANGERSMADIPRSVKKSRVLELVDYYTAQKATKTGLLQQQRIEINDALREQARELIGTEAPEINRKGLSKLFDPSKGLVLYHRTPQRIMRALFGWKQGQKINEAVFEPVYENEQERKRFINRLFDEVRTFEGADGEKSALNKDESAFAQKLKEGRTVEELVEKSGVAESIRAAAENLKNGAEMKDAAREFNLDEGSRNLTRQYADWLQTQEDYAAAENVDRTKVENAIEKYTELYDKLYAAINDFLVAHGYEPIGFIKGYAPHFQPEAENGKLESALKAIGVDLGSGVGKLPTSIAGLTKSFKPNKRYNPFFQHRRGSETDYDIVKGFETYVDYASDVLYHTDDIMRVRQMANYLRSTFAPEEMKADIDQMEAMRYAPADVKEEYLRDKKKIADDTFLSYEDLTAMMEQYTDEKYRTMEDVTEFSDLVTWLDDYANKLAGKQLFEDRLMEREVGREALNGAKKLNRMFARANVAGNLSSALNQTAQLPMIATELGQKNTWRAVGDILRGKTTGMSAFRGESDFLTEKSGIDYIQSTKGEKALKVLFSPLEKVDTLVSTIAVRGKYRMELDAGKSPKEAMKAADRWARDIMGTRSKGSVPLTFQSKNLIAQMMNMFQVEAANTFEHVTQDRLGPGFKEMATKIGKDKAIKKLASDAIAYMLLAFLLNRLDEELYGGTPAPFDVLGMGLNAVASGNGLTSSDLLKTIMDNVTESFFGERLFDTDPDAMNDEFDGWAAAEDTMYNISNDVPYVRNVSGLLGVGDQTLPMPDLYGTAKGIGGAFADAAEGDMRSFSEEIARQLMGLAGDTLPGGRQAEKTAQGIEAVARGGSYKGSGDNKRLQYPVESPLEDPWTALRAAIFGKNALPESRTYWAAGGRALSAAQTRLYEDLVDSGLSRKRAYEILKRFNDATADLEADRDKNGNPIGGSKKEKIVTEINKLPLSRKQKNMLYLSRGYSEKDLNSLPWN